MVRVIKKIPLLSLILKGGHALCLFLVMSLLHTSFYMKNLLRDPPIIKENLFWYKEIKKTQRSEKSPLFWDRQREVMDFFNISYGFLLLYYLKWGVPSSVRFKRRLMGFFSRNDQDTILKKSYEEASFHYTLRLMFAYEKYSFIIPYIDFMIKELKKPIEKFKMLDYGCGVSDIGLLFACLGAEVTIV